MGCAPHTCCKIPCGCCALGFGWPLYHCICFVNSDVEINGVESKIKPPIPTSAAFNTEFCRLRQSATDNKSLRTTVNSWKPQSLIELISSLSTYCAHKSLIDQTWIVFYWITQNISYDVDSYLNNRIPAQTASDVFRNMKGVCEGYASLFLHLCTAIGLKCVKISGYAKGHGYEVRGNKFDGTNHAWNAVEIGSFWYLVDSTWGEGSLAGNVSKKKLELYYFLVRPEQFVYTHLPADKNWQLLAEPLTMKQFLSMPRPWPPFFELKLQLVDKNLTNIVHLKPNESFAEIALRCPPDVALLCSIKQNSEKVNGGDLIQYDHEEDVYKCLFAPKHSGWHELHIFAKKSSTAGSYSSAIQFSIDVPKSMKKITFPTTYGLFAQKKCCLYAPLSHVLQKGSQVTICCRIPGAQRVALILDSKKWVYDDGFQEETMNLTVTVPDKSVTINANFDKPSWSTLVEYVVE
jgi:hypothetical protein